jgi:hypothetical protein
MAARLWWRSAHDYDPELRWPVLVRRLVEGTWQRLRHFAFALRLPYPREPVEARTEAEGRAALDLAASWAFEQAKKNPDFDVEDDVEERLRPIDHNIIEALHSFNGKPVRAEKLAGKAGNRESYVRQRMKRLQDLGYVRKTSKGYIPGDTPPPPATEC